MNDTLLLPLIITGIFWAYREFSHLLQYANWREERRELLVMMQGIPITTSTPSIPETPKEKLTPEQRREQEEEDSRRLHSERWRQMEQERIAQLIADSEAGLNDMMQGSRINVVD